jgi:hypothetical protein
VFAVNSSDTIGGDLATFRYSITDTNGVPGGGVFLDTSRPDSLVVEWGMTEGLYRVGVQEIAYGGCEGEWTYLVVDLKGTRFIPDASYRIVGGNPAQIPISPNLWKNVRWTPNTVTNSGQGIYLINQVGTYQVTMEDTHGCRHSETIVVTN